MFACAPSPTVPRYTLSLTAFGYYNKLRMREGASAAAAAASNTVRETSPVREVSPGDGSPSKRDYHLER